MPSTTPREKKRRKNECFFDIASNDASSRSRSALPVIASPGWSRRPKRHLKIFPPNGPVWGGAQARLRGFAQKKSIVATVFAAVRRCVGALGSHPPIASADARLRSSPSVRRTRRASGRDAITPVVEAAAVETPPGKNRGGIPTRRPRRRRDSLRRRDPATRPARLPAGEAKKNRPHDGGRSVLRQEVRGLSGPRPPAVRRSRRGTAVR